jgi:hypothetical protein
MIYFSIDNPDRISANNFQLIGAFGDSSNSNILSTKLEDYTVVPLSYLFGGFFASGTTDGQDFIIESDLLTDIGLVVNFETDGGSNYLGNFYGVDSEYNTEFGEYFGANLEANVDFVFAMGSFGTVNIIPKAAAAQVATFNVYGGSTLDTKMRFRANDDDDNVSANFFSTLGLGIQIQTDGATDENGIYFTGHTQNIITSDGVLNIDVQDTIALISALDDISITTSAQDIILDSAANLTMDADVILVTVTDDIAFTVGDEIQFTSSGGSFTVQADETIDLGAVTSYIYLHADDLATGNITLQAISINLNSNIAGVTDLDSNVFNLNSVNINIPGAAVGIIIADIDRLSMIGLGTYIDNATAAGAGLVPGDHYYLTATNALTVVV